MSTKIAVNNSTTVVNGYEYAYYNESSVSVRVTSPCEYCNKPVTYVRGGISCGSKFHWECYKNTPEQKALAKAFQESVCGSLSPKQYQIKHGLAWSE